MTAYAITKRLFDLTVSLAALAATLPAWLAIAAAIRLDSKGPAIFRQKRVGRHGSLFTVLKFRTMVADAPSLGDWHTADNDPRITRTGRFLRASSLDELPQLWNIVTGDMSLVGPRPNTPQQRAQYTDEQWHARHLVRPGITGLAQVSGRSALELQQQIDYDLRYVAQCSWRTDLSILFQTLRIVLRGGGAN